VAKTLRYEHDVNDRNVDRNRRDAMSLERLTRSHLVVGIYGYCSTSGLFEYSDGGDIYAALWPRSGNPHNVTALEKLSIGELGQEEGGRYRYGVFNANVAHFFS